MTNKKILAIGQVVDYAYAPFPKDLIAQTYEALGATDSNIRIGESNWAPKGVTASEFIRVAARFYPDIETKMEHVWSGDIVTTLQNAKAVAPGIDCGLIADIPDSAQGKDIKSALLGKGITLQTPFVESDHIIAPCLILTDPTDGEKTVVVHEGSNMEEHTLQTDQIANSDVVFVTAYLENNFDLAKLTDTITTNLKEDGKAVLHTAAAYCIEGKEELFRTIVPKFTATVGDDQQFKMIYQAETLEDAIQKHTQNLNACGSQTVSFVTLGAKGSMVIYPNGTTSFVPAMPDVKVKDTSSAGDTFNSGASLSLLFGLDPQTGAALGNQLSANVITHVGSHLDPVENVVSPEILGYFR